MIRSLYAGISGLRTHQVGLDVTANNIANVNTVAFKAGRATFKESMVQMLQGASRPAGNQGGTNPMQLGLGVAVGSIDTMLRQGNYNSTGQITDLALEGRAYFAFSNGNATYYSRNGGLQLDAEGFLVSPTNGFRLQGKMARADGTYGPDTMIGDLRIPWGDKTPAKATDLVTFACNLNSDSHALGTVTHTNRFLANSNVLNAGNMAERGALTNLFDADGNSLGITLGDSLTFRVADTNVPIFRYAVEEYPVVDEVTGEVTMQTPTLQDFMNRLEAYLNAVNSGSDSLTLSADMNAYMAARAEDGTRGSIRINLNTTTGGLDIVNDSGSNINGLQVSSSRLANSNSFVSNTFLFPATVGANRPVGFNGPEDLGTMGNTSYTSPGIRIPADASDVLGSLYDASGRNLGFTNGDDVIINGKVGNKSKNVNFTFYDGSDGVNPPTSMQTLLTALQEAFGLPPSDGTIYNRPSVSMKNPNDMVSDGIPAGSIVLRGQPETAFSITGITVMGKQADPNQVSAPSHFNMNMSFTERQSARDSGVHPISYIVYDDAGAQHSFVMTFTHTGTPNEWLWEVTMTGGEQVILGGNRGKLTFGVDHSPASFTFDDGSNEFRFDPRNGSSEVAIKLDVGTAGSHLGITQFESTSTTAITSQNGYAMGKLAEISIGENGEITGQYTNGINKSIAQIFVAEFNNPAGLMKMGDSMFAVSNNSGQAAMYQPMHGSTTKIKPGALEMSNVELETEFTNMITIQRGYQASARVISTSDQMLQELVQLVR